MIIRTIIYCLIAVYLTLLISCSKSLEYIGPVGPPVYGQNGSFPNKTGNIWVFDVIDSVSNGTINQRYTVTVKIVASIKSILGDTVQCWQYAYPTYNDTNYVISSKDSVSIFPNRVGINDTFLIHRASLKLYQPFATWMNNKSSLIYPWITLRNDTTISTPYQGNVYTYNVWYYQPSNYAPTFYNYWYKDSVGLIKKQLSTLNVVDNFIYYTIWNLKSYTLN